MVLYVYRGCMIRGDRHVMEVNNNLYIYQENVEVAMIRNVAAETCYTTVYGKEVAYYTVRDL